MKTEELPQIEPRVAATVVGEDIACGDYVALLNEVIDLPSYFWNASDVSLSPHELVRLKIIPHAAGEPLRVIAVCLPFVYAKTPRGDTTTIDTRRTQLVRLPRRIAKRIWKKLRAAAKKQESSSIDV